MWNHPPNLSLKNWIFEEEGITERMLIEDAFEDDGHIRLEASDNDDQNDE